MKTLLEARNIDKYFHHPVSFQVLKDISLQVAEGEFVSIMGKSGCGKSTLLYILSTMDTEYGGTLRFNGVKITGNSKAQLAAIRNRYIGFIFSVSLLTAGIHRSGKCDATSQEIGPVKPSRD